VQIDKSFIYFILNRIESGHIKIMEYYTVTPVLQ